MVVRTFGSLTYMKSTNKWLFDEIEPHVMIKLKSIFKRINRTQTSPFEMNHSKEFALDLHWFLQRYPLAITPEDMNFLVNCKDEQLSFVASLEELLSPDYVPKVADLKKPLRHYQAVAVDLFVRGRHLLIGDVVGLGKTVDAIGAWCDPSTRPAAVVVQTHLPNQWDEKIKEFSDLKVHIVKGGPVYQLPPADVYIFKYSQLHKWVDVFGQGFIKTVVFDEIQELRKDDSAKYRAAEILARSTTGVLGLSATPIFNYGSEIWNIMNIIKEGCLDTKEAFTREWCGGGFRGIVTDTKALGTYLRENHLFLRRTREEVGMELPPVNTVIETVEYDHEEVDRVQELASVLATKVLHGSYYESGQAARELDIMLRQVTGISKAKQVAEYVKMLVESGESVLLAGWHREVYDIWNRELQHLNPVMYTGSESPSQKKKAKDDFICGNSNLMMISLRSGVGLDGLQRRGSIVVFGELDWSPAIHEQVIGRLNRDGQQQQVTAIFLVSNGGSDPGIVEMLGLKSSQASGILDPLLGAQIQHKDSSRIKELARKYLKSKGIKMPEQGELNV